MLPLIFLVAITTYVLNHSKMLNEELHKEVLNEEELNEEIQ